LPQPPDDREKYSYVERHLWVLTCCSLVSFSCLAVSQFRLAQSTFWLWLYLLWLYLPFLAFTILYHLVSLQGAADQLPAFLMLVLPMMLARSAAVGAVIGAGMMRRPRASRMGVIS
jgi:hypothetical protein